MPQILIASANPHKIAEMSEILSDLGIEIIPQTVLNEIPDVEETGETLEENALLKARAFHELSNMAVLADDTGLEVDVLGGRPGVRTARYAGETASYADNVRKLLQELQGVPELERTARFRTVIAFIQPNADPIVVQGVVEGRIAASEHGSAGFGYDPVFIPDDGDGRTFAEMEAAEKHAISHRGRALQAFRRILSET